MHVAADHSQAALQFVQCWFLRTPQSARELQTKVCWRTLQFAACCHCNVATVLNWNLSTALLQVVLDYVAPLQCKVYWCTPKWREQWNVQCGTTAVHWCTAISPLQRHLQLIFAWLASCHPWTTPSKGTFAIITMLHKHCKCIYMAFHFSEQ